MPKCYRGDPIHAQAIVAFTVGAQALVALRVGASSNLHLVVGTNVIKRVQHARLLSLRLLVVVVSRVA